MNTKVLKNLNIAIIIFAVFSVLIGIFFIVRSVDSFSTIVNDDASSEIATMFKESDTSENNEISNYEKLLQNNGYSFPDMIKNYTAIFIMLFIFYFIIMIVLNILSIIFSSVVIKRRNDKDLIFFTTKFSVFTLIISILTLNLINVILSICSIVKIRQRVLSLI